MPGEKQGWRPAPDLTLAAETASRTGLSRILQTRVSALAVSGNYIYAGGANGRIYVSSDQGRSWLPVFPAADLAVESIFVDPTQPAIALVAAGGRLWRTVNGGLFWQDEDAEPGRTGPTQRLRTAPAAPSMRPPMRASSSLLPTLTPPDRLRQWASLSGNLPPGAARDPETRSIRQPALYCHRRLRALLSRGATPVP